RDLTEVAGLLEPGLLRVIEWGMGLSAVDLMMAYRQRAHLRQRIHPVMERFDLLAMPTVPISPFPADRHEPTVPVEKGAPPWLAWCPGAYLFNLTGQPAISVPAGLSRRGLPIGVQLVGGWCAERVVIRVARALEEARPWRDSYAGLDQRA